MRRFCTQISGAPLPDAFIGITSLYLSCALVGFLDALELYFSGHILIPDFDLELKDKYTKYNARLYEIEGQIQGEGKSDFLDQINSDMAEGGVLSNFQTHLVNTLLNELEHNTTVRSLFEQSAKRKSGT